MSYDRRLAAARAAMEEAGVGAMVVSGLVNIRYLTGFTGSNGLVVIGPEAATLLTDFRYQTASGPLRAWVDVELAERDVIRTAADRLGDLSGGADRIGFEPALLTVDRHAILAAGHAGMTAVPGLIESLRVVKDDEELDAIRASAALIEPVYAAIASEGLIGRERAGGGLARARALPRRRRGHASPSTRSSPRTSAAPSRTRSRPRYAIGADTLVTIDLGCMLDGYGSDCTRTFATGTPPPELARAYDVCLQAQRRRWRRSGPACPRAPSTWPPAR